MCMLNRSYSTYKAFAGKGRDFPEAVCMWKRSPPAQKMGQKVSHEDKRENKAETLVICEVFSHGVVCASQRLKDYLGFMGPQSKFQPGTNTPSKLFLVNFSFLAEKGVEERIVTSKMTKQQSSLFGVDQIWTLSGADKRIQLQIAVQALQLAELSGSEGVPAEAAEGCSRREAVLADECFQNGSGFEKLAEICRVVGRDCLGLFLMFGVPGKPKAIRGVMLDSIAKEEQKCCLLGRKALRQFVTSTDSFLPTKDVLENCLGAKNGPKEVGNMYINFL